MFMKEQDNQKNVKKERERGKMKINIGGEKRRRDSPNPSGSDLSHFEGGFPKVLREWMLGF